MIDKRKTKGLIVDKQIAIRYIQSGNFKFENIDKRLLQDKDIALAYMRKYSSNEMLFDGFPIDIAQPGMIDDQVFILNVIKNFGEDYSKTSAWQMIKYSTIMIVKKESGKLKTVNAEMLKDFSKRVLTRYNNMVKKRDEELKQGRTLMDEVCDYIRDFKLDAFDEQETKEDKPQQAQKNEVSDKYKRCKIGFTADIK